MSWRALHYIGKVQFWPNRAIIERSIQHARLASAKRHLRAALVMIPPSSLDLGCRVRQ